MKKCTSVFFFFVVTWVYIIAQDYPSWVPEPSFTSIEEGVEITTQALSNATNVTEKIQSLFILGQLYGFANLEDESLAYYISCLELQKKTSQPPNQIADVLFQIHRTISSQENYDTYGLQFLNELKVVSDSIQSPFYSSQYMYLHALEEYDTYYSNYEEKYLKNALLEIDTILQNDIQSESLYFDVLNLKHLILYDMSEKETSLQLIDSCITIAQKLQDIYREKVGLFNKGNYYYNEKKWDSAVRYLKMGERITNDKYTIKFQKLIYKRLEQTYDSLHLDGPRKQYAVLFDEIEKEIDNITQNIAISNQEKQYENQHLKEKLSIYEKFVRSYKKYKVYYTVGLIITFLLSLYSFIRWKKADYQKKNIETKHKESLKKVEKIKKFIEDEKITLKNKSTISINEILYIQVDGHYLNFYLTTGKKEFVRGRLTEIIEELPPHFVQVHRSYAINKNHTEQILSKEIVMKNGDRLPRSRSKFKNEL